jgi:hypothetical protein
MDWAHVQRDDSFAPDWFQVINRLAQGGRIERGAAQPSVAAGGGVAAPTWPRLTCAQRALSFPASAN